MARSKGIRLGRKLVKLFKWRTRRTAAANQLLAPREGPITKLCKWVQSFRRKAAAKTKPGYIQLGGDRVAPPKGHLAVYVGEKEGNFSRVVVPVLYFNHPLFVSLLREAEKVYGFDHPGGIQIPCPISELERVRMKIADGGGICRSRRRLFDHLDFFLWDYVVREQGLLDFFFVFLTRFFFKKITLLWSMFRDFLVQIIFSIRSLMRHVEIISN